MKDFRINENDAGQRVDKFLSKAIKKMPKSMMYKAIRNKKIKVNRKRCSIDQILQVGDSIQCFLPPDVFDTEVSMDFLKAKITFEVVYEDDFLLIVDKPANTLVHQANMSDNDLVNQIKRYCYEKGEYNPYEEHSFSPSLCHRIDRNTTGLVIAAKKASALRFVNECIRNRSLKKYYLCICEGVFEKKHALLKHYYKKDEELNKAFIFDDDRDSGLEVSLTYRVLKDNDSFSLVEVELISGKSHQIRAQLSHMHHPLLGDSKYGSKYRRKDGQALCAYRLIFAESIAQQEFKYLEGKEIKLKRNGLQEEYKRLEADFIGRK